MQLSILAIGFLAAAANAATVIAPNTMYLLSWCVSSPRIPLKPNRL